MGFFKYIDVYPYESTGEIILYRFGYEMEYYYVPPKDRKIMRVCWSVRVEIAERSTSISLKDST